MESEFVIALKKKQCPERQGKGHDCHGVPNTPLKQLFPECCISLRTAQIKELGLSGRVFGLC